MKTILSQKLEDGRVTGHSIWASKAGDLFGAFIIQGPCGSQLTILTSGPGDEQYGWEHVSVSTARRPPNWEEMCWVKNQFWEDEEAVMQLHPRKSQYVNCHPYTLHLWRPCDGGIPEPQMIQV